MEIVKASFRPEFINRIDEITLFHRLDKNNIKDIAKIQIANIEKRLRDRNIAINVNDAAFVWIVNNGYDAVYGARPLKRLLKTQLENKLAIKIIDGEITDNDVADVIVNNGSLDIVKRKHS
jgi:ATP-dependent Clp protease ATP-binding subunit ClpB